MNSNELVEDPEEILYFIRTLFIEKNQNFSNVKKERPKLNIEVANRMIFKSLGKQVVGIKIKDLNTPFKKS